MKVTRPGVYDLIEAAYHDDPVPGGSLSSTGVRLLTSRTPAHYDYWRTSPPERKAQFDIGSAAHRMVLGVGPDVVRVEVDGQPVEDWKTPAARAARDEVYADCKVPLTGPQYAHVTGMRDALREHSTASLLLDGVRGQPEASLFWRHPDTATWCRGRVDVLHSATRAGLLHLPDYKTTTDVSDDAVRKLIGTYAYHQQLAWYGAGAVQLGLCSDVRPWLVLQEKSPPYIVRCVQLDPDDLARGAQLNERAVRLYADCTHTGHWPGYPETSLLGMPTYARTREEDLL